MTTRELALKWWNTLPFEFQFTHIVKNKELITGYPDRGPKDLTGREIEDIWKASDNYLMVLNFNEFSEEFMQSIGYRRVYHPDRENGHLGYDRFANIGGTEGTFYGPMFEGKRIITFNFEWHDKYVFCEILEDGGTRKVFHGGVRTREDLKKILSLVY